MGKRLELLYVISRLRESDPFQQYLHSDETLFGMAGVHEWPYVTGIKSNTPYHGLLHAKTWKK